MYSFNDFKINDIYRCGNVLYQVASKNYQEKKLLGRVVNGEGTASHYPADVDQAWFCDQ